MVPITWFPREEIIGNFQSALSHVTANGRLSSDITAATSSPGDWMWLGMVTVVVATVTMMSRLISLNKTRFDHMLQLQAEQPCWTAGQVRAGGKLTSDL